MACKYGNTIGVFGFLASMGFIGGEFLFERMSSVKSRKRYVMADMGFSGMHPPPPALQILKLYLKYFI